MAINIQIKKGKNDSSLSVLNKFSRKIKESGIIPKVKSKRYAERELSKLKRKKDKLVKLEAKGKYEYLKKMGKLQVKTWTPRTTAPTTQPKTESK